MKATREAYGEALVKFGSKYLEIVALDAETKNSTYAELFKAKFPDRFFDCFIAEQNMVGMAVGMSRMGKIPFVSTFAAFLTRAYDQIRMSAYSRSNIKLVGSHVGVSIGPDGASQMALEDIAMMRAVLGSTVLYPADAVATEQLVEQMIKTKGICYLRTTREKTPIIYQENEEFPIGEFKIHKSTVNSQQQIVKKIIIITAGITLFEALKAQEELGKEGVDVMVVDLYSIKPINKEELVKALELPQSGVLTNIITVEDHYFEGGLGDAVLNVFTDVPNVTIKKLAVISTPHSGTPAENLHRVGIDTKGIVKSMKAFV